MNMTRALSLSSLSWEHSGDNGLLLLTTGIIWCRIIWLVTGNTNGLQLSLLPNLITCASKHWTSVLMNHMVPLGLSSAFLRGMTASSECLKPLLSFDHHTAQLLLRHLMTLVSCRNPRRAPWPSSNLRISSWTAHIKCKKALSPNHQELDLCPFLNLSIYQTCNSSQSSSLSSSPDSVQLNAHHTITHTTMRRVIWTR